ncbi:MAG: flagellar basal body rod protein FlgB [Oscillospiraceae bacterium]|nr:flagellar basal body rod protein FlgB [Oscillospiraceae bacterium]
MWNNIFRPLDLIQRGLSASWQRDAVIRNNIANVETPGFKASYLEFETLLARSIQESSFIGKMTHPDHRQIGAGNFDNIQPVIRQSKELSMRADGNNVDIESENVRLAQNSIFYNALVERLNSEIRRLRMAISEGIQRSKTI